jgi:uncharacterized tellurite resistance protein B-like protein
MGILDLLGLTGRRSEASNSDDVESIRRISKKLEELEPNKARFVAAFAYLLSRVAYADRVITSAESEKMEQILIEKGHLPGDQAVMAVEIAKSQNRLLGHVENFLVTREFNELASRQQKLELLDCLFAVCATDRLISVAEDNEIRQISSELLLEHREFIDIRSKYREYLGFLKQENQ